MIKELKNKSESTIMDLNIKNAMTEAAKKKLEESKKEGYTKI